MIDGIIDGIRRFVVPGREAELAAWEADFGRAIMAEYAATPCPNAVPQTVFRDQWVRKTVDDPHLMGCVLCLCRFWHGRPW